MHSDFGGSRKGKLRTANIPFLICYIFVHYRNQGDPMPGALFSRLNRSFGPPPAIPERRTGALEKIETAAVHYPLQLETVAEIAPTMADKTVIVIGAGFAGLTAGWWLATHGFDVTVLEARNACRRPCPHEARKSAGSRMRRRAHWPKSRQLASARQLFWFGLEPDQNRRELCRRRVEEPHVA